MIAQRGRVSRAEMEKTFNMGVGMLAVVAPEDTDRALAILTARHLNCWVLGTINKGGKGGPRAKLVGQHPRFRLRPAVQASRGERQRCSSSQGSSPSDWSAS